MRIYWTKVSSILWDWSLRTVRAEAVRQSLVESPNRADAEMDASRLLILKENHPHRRMEHSGDLMAGYVCGVEIGRAHFAASDAKSSITRRPISANKLPDYLLFA
jgi:hypothetical protein